MEKRQARLFVQNISRGISQSERKLTSDRIFQEFVELSEVAHARCIALFCDLPDEVAASGWIEPLVQMGYRVVLPRVEGDDMEFYGYCEGELKVGAYGIVEPQGREAISPSEIDVMIIPGVAFCRDGRRLGRGKGFYDKYLAREGFRAYKVGVGYTHQLVAELPTEPHDMVVDRLIIPFVTSPIPDIMRRVVDCAGDDASRIGFGIERLLPMGYSWVLLRYKMSLVRTPEADESLVIDTWINSFGRLTSMRNFTIKDGDGRYVGDVVTQWCMIDLSTRRPVDLTVAALSYCKYVMPRDGAMEITGKLTSFERGDEDLDSYNYVASQSDIDFNRHVNTFKYIEMMLRMLPHSTLIRRAASSVDVQFVKECYLGEELRVVHKQLTDGGADDLTPSTHADKFEILHHDGTVAVRALFKISPIYQ